MTKLLDYRPEVDSRSLIKTVMEDVWFNHTPDVAQLRYAGPQYVFVWDHMQDSGAREKLGISSKTDCRVDYWSATTVRQYVPFVNSNPDADPKENSVYFAPTTAMWTNSFGIQGSQPRPLVGRLVKCGLNAMRKLDQYYGNGYLTNRRIESVYTTGERDNDKMVDAWVYVTGVDQIGKYDPHNQTWVLKHNINPSMVSSVRRYNTELYEANQYYRSVKVG
jgi:hypothetical protein